jgi:hypothetical protein
VEISLVVIVPELAQLREACEKAKPESRFLWALGLDQHSLALMEVFPRMPGQSFIRRWFPEHHELIRFTESSPSRLTICDARVHDMITFEMLERVRSALARVCSSDVVLERMMVS